jgi:hypothetical protein
MTRLAPAAHVLEMSKSSVLQGAAAKPSSLSTTPTDCTSNIKCHHCHGVSHFERDCPSKKFYIAIDDRGYVSATDDQDDFALQINLTEEREDDDDDDAQVFGSEQGTLYDTKTHVVEWVLSGHMDNSEKHQ